MHLSNCGSPRLRLFLVTSLLLLLAHLYGLSENAFSQDSDTDSPLPDARREVYKQVGDVELSLYIFEPEGHRVSDRRPAAVFFFGGGWNGGKVTHFAPHCRYLASRGMVTIAADYRVKSRHGTTPFECVQDGKSAMRWVRAHAGELGVDPQRIAAGGGSAGGHVAAATATVQGLNEAEDALDVSPVPNALLLFNPVYDNGPEGYGHARVKERFAEISPLHNVRPGMPPAIVFLGTEDALIPVATAEEFQRRMQAAGSRSELRLYPGQPHGFFNHPSYRKNALPNYYYETVREMDEFLASLGYLAGPPTLAPPKFQLKARANNTLDIYFGERLLARYMHAFDDSTAETRHETYKPYLHLFDKQGEAPITKGPGGKYTHHRGIFLGFNKIEFEGRQYDLWHMKQGVQVHQTFTHQSADERGAEFTSLISWQDNSGKRILTEHRTLRFLPPRHRAYAVVELESRLEATAGDIVLQGDPEHAGAQFRPADDIATEKTTYTFPTEDIDPKRDLDLPWVGESFSVGGGVHSAVILNHPENPRGTKFSAYRDYGRFGAYPVVRLAQGKAATLRYRWLISGGEMLPADVIRQAHRDFARAKSEN